MSYIGQRPVVGRYIKLDQISSGFNGSNTGFSMTAGSQAVFPGTARNLLLSLGGVIQEPDTDFTISGSTLTFTTPPVANTTFFGVIYGDMQATGTPSDGTVLPASIASSGNFSFPQLTVTSSASLLGGAVFNENGADVDFRVEGDTDTHLLVADASSDKVAIGVNPSSQAFAGKFHVKLSTDKHIVFNDGQGEVGNVPCIIPINDSSVVTDLGFRANHLNFAAGTGSQSLAQKMTIDNTGVAIGQGNIDAAAFFHIRCGSDKNIHYSGGIGEIGSVAGFQTVNDAANTLTGFGIRASEMNFAIGSSTVFRLHTDGNVGINDSSPRAELSVAAVSGNAPHIDIGQASSNNFKLGYDSGNCFLGAAASAGQFIFKNNVNSDGHPQASGTEHMRIDASGRVLIGHSSNFSGYSLQISGGDVENSSLSLSRFKANASSSILEFNKSRNNGIGSNTVVQNNDTVGVIRFKGADGTDYSQVADIQAAIDGTPGDNDTPGRLVFSTTADGAQYTSERMRINSSGNLLIGNTSSRDLGGLSTQKLTIEDTSGNAAIGIINNQNSGGFASLRFAKSRGTSVGSNTVVQSGDPLGGIVFCGADGTDMASVGAQILAEVDGTPGSNDMPGRLEFFTTTNGSASSTERLRIDNQGRSLFSGTLGYANIPLNGNPANAAIQIRTTSKYNGIAFGEGFVSGSIGLGGDDTTTAMVFVANAAPANLGGGVHDTFEWHSGTSGGGGPGKIMTIDTSGDLTLEDGDLVIGTSGHGIDFSTTSDATGNTSELLDDYEEGTFSLAASGQTVTNSSSRYTKIGRFVHCTGRLDFGSAGLPSNIINMSGLPFTPFSGISNSACGGTIPEHNLGNGAYFMAVESTSVRIRLNGSAITQADVQNKSVRYSFTYQTD